MIDESAIRLRFKTLDPVLDERARRRLAAAEAISAGRGGISAVSRATGIARGTIGWRWPNCALARRWTQIAFERVGDGATNGLPIDAELVAMASSLCLIIAPLPPAKGDSIGELGGPAGLVQADSASGKTGEFLNAILGEN